jgi:hypothetical protein
MAMAKQRKSRKVAKKILLVTRRPEPRVDHDLLDRFLAHVLECHKAGTKTQSEAIADLAHLIAALDLGPGEGDDPNAYMRAIIEKPDEDQ